jgi:hypothetical protein
VVNGALQLLTTTKKQGESPTLVVRVGDRLRWSRSVSENRVQKHIEQRDLRKSNAMTAGYMIHCGCTVRLHTRSTHRHSRQVLYIC